MDAWWVDTRMILEDAVNESCTRSKDPCLSDVQPGKGITLLYRAAVFVDVDRVQRGAKVTKKVKAGDPETV